MREYTGNLWDFINPDAIVITTNGDRNVTGRLIMGAGNAKEARDRFPSLDEQLGKLVENGGNKVYCVSTKDLSGKPFTIVSLPTKHSYKDTQSDLMLIATGLANLVDMADQKEWLEIIVPRPGVGNGKLSWDTQIRPLCESFLDDRFIVCDFVRE